MVEEKMRAGDFQSTILVVDDDPDNLKILQLILKQAGFVVVTKRSARSAWDHLAQQTADLILLDIMMSDIDGYTLCQQLKADPATADIPVIFVSALDEVEDIVRGFEAGGVDYLTKPFESVEVVARIQTHLRLRQTQQRLEEEVERRQNAEDALRYSEARYRTIFANSLNAIALHQIIVDDAGVPVDYVFLEANSAFEQFTGLPLDQVIGRRVTEVLADDDMSHYIAIYGSVALGGEPRSFEDYVESLDRYYEISVYAAEPGQFVVFFHDITQRKKGEIERMRLWTAVEQSSSSIVMTDVNGNIEYVNPKFSEVTGYALEEVLGENPRLLNSGTQSQAFYENLWQTILSGESWYGEFCNRRKDGTLYWEQASIAPVVDDTGTIRHFLAVKDDITERRQLEAEALRAHKLDVELAKERELTVFRDRLVSMLSHEFRTPLAVIQTASGLLAKYFDQLAPTRRSELLGQIEQAVEHNVTILDKTLALRRAEAGVIDITPITVDLDLFVENAVDRMQFTDDGEHILEFSGSGVGRVAVDVELFEHILQNLISNALKYSGDGSRVCVTLDLDERGQNVVLSVSDDGIGIPEEDLPRIFETYHRGTNVGRVRGTGLGLSIVKAYVELHGGTISCRSQVGVGTTFELSIPKNTP